MNLLRILGLVATIAAGVIQADVVDLTAGIGTSGSANGAYFEAISVQPTGTGVFGPFLRVQLTGNETCGAKGSNVECGYNTDGTLQYDSKPGPHTHSLLIGDVGTYTNPATATGDYRLFIADLAEQQGPNDPPIVIDQMYLYSTTNVNQTGYDQTNHTWSDGIPTLLYNFDSNKDNSVKIAPPPGNGVADLLIAIPESVFAGHNGDYLNFFIFFSQSGGSFEELASVGCPPTDPDNCGRGGGGGNPVPEPSSIVMLGSAMLVAGSVLRKKLFRS